jgi:hypothetical protein
LDIKSIKTAYNSTLPASPKEAAVLPAPPLFLYGAFGGTFLAASHFALLASGQIDYF